MPNLDYIECAGVRVPADWSIRQLREALSKRKMRFKNEKEIMNVFGDAVNLKAKLEARIHELSEKIKILETRILTT